MSTEKVPVWMQRRLMLNCAICGKGPYNMLGLRCHMRLAHTEPGRKQQESFSKSHKSGSKETSEAILNNTKTKVKCPICGKEFSVYGLPPHMYMAHGDGSKAIPHHKGKTGSIPWNKGKSYKTSEKLNALRKKNRSRIPYYLELDDDNKLRKKYNNKRWNAKAVNLEVKITFEEWCLLMHEAGIKSSDLGYSGGGYDLARYNDTGDYEMGNCRFIPHSENMEEMFSHTYAGHTYTPNDVKSKSET